MTTKQTPFTCWEVSQVRCCKGCIAGCAVAVDQHVRLTRTLVLSFTADFASDLSSWALRESHVLSMSRVCRPQLQIPSPPFVTFSLLLCPVLVLSSSFLLVPKKSLFPIPPPSQYTHCPLSFGSAFVSPKFKLLKMMLVRLHKQLSAPFPAF